MGKLSGNHTEREPKYKGWARNKAAWIVNIMNYNRHSGGRTQLPIDPRAFGSRELETLGSAIEEICQGNYEAAEKLITEVSLPNVNGRETAFKLHARLIIEEYREQTSVTRNGQRNCMAFFTTGGVTSDSRQFIRDLERFLVDGTYEKQAYDLNKILGRDLSGIGLRLQSILVAYGVLDRNDSKLNGEYSEDGSASARSMQTAPSILEPPRSEAESSLSDHGAPPADTGATQPSFSG